MPAGPSPARSAGPLPLTMRRLLNLYIPLAFTFLLMSGSNPIINKGIAALPDETVGLAAFANAISVCLFLYSPCFIVRDAAQKFVRGRTSCRRATVFHLAVALFCTGLLLLVSLTTLTDGLLLSGLMRLPPGLLGPVKRGILSFLPMPVLVTLRGVYQAVHVTNDTPKWIGIGTGVRFAVMIGFTFLVGVPLRIEGGVLGGLAFGSGILVETAMNYWTCRRHSAYLGADPPGLVPPTFRRLWAFSGPLFLANAMGVFMQPLAIAVVNTAQAPEASAAAFGIVKSFTWFFASTLFAMQTIAIAKADSRANLRRLAAFQALPAAAFSLLTAATAWIRPVRDAVVSGFFEVDDPQTAQFAIAAMAPALLVPLLMGLRSTARGLVMRSGRTVYVTLSSLASLGALLLVYVLRPAAALADGATIGFACWMGALGLEFVVLLLGLARIGLDACVADERHAVSPVLADPVPEAESLDREEPVVRA